MNGREMRAPVKFALRAAAKEGGGRQMVTCTAADGTVLHAGLPVSVKAAGGQSGAGELLWLDDPAQVYRGSFEFISADNGQGGQGGLGGQAVTLVNVVSLEDYVAGVVPYEIGASSPDHALRVQAVVARTEAVTAGRRHADSGFDICATTHCQVYQGAARELANPAVRAAVLATAGEVLMYGGRLTGSNYHACCGGYTESAEALWKADIPYQRTVACRPEALGDACVVAAGGEGRAWPTIEAPLDEAAVRRIIENPNPSDYCYGSNGYRWTYSATPAELAASVSAVIGVRPEIVGIEVLQRTPRGAAMLVAVVTPDGRHEIAGELAIRLALGADGSEERRVRGGCGGGMRGRGAGGVHVLGSRLWPWSRAVPVRREEHGETGHGLQGDTGPLLPRHHSGEIDCRCAVLGTVEGGMRGWLACAW